MHNSRRAYIKESNTLKKSHIKISRFGWRSPLTPAARWPLSLAAFLAVFAVCIAIWGYSAWASPFGLEGRSAPIPPGASAVALSDGRTLVAGGRGSNGVLAETQFIQANGQVSPGPSMTVARSGHAVVALADGRVLVVGGSGSSAALDSAEVYDPATNRWTPASAMTEARAGLTAALLPDGRVLVAGGASLDIFEPATASFQFAGALNPPRSGHAAAVLTDGRVLLTGGVNSGGPLAFADIYDPVSGQLQPVAGLTSPRFGHSSTALADGRVVLAGGSNGGADLSSVELFDPVTQSFSAAAASLQTPRSGHRASLLPNGTQILISDGATGGEALNTVELLSADVASGAASASGSGSPKLFAASVESESRIAAAQPTGGTKASGDIDQCRNGGVGAAPLACAGAAWVNGNAGASNAHWLEGDSIAYRIKFSGISTGPANTHTVTIEWDTTQSGKHAIDYLTRWDRTVLDVSRLAPTPGADQATGSDACTDVLGAAQCAGSNVFTIPADPNVTGAGVTPVAGQFVLYGGTITGVSSYTLSGTYAGSSSTRIAITFTSTVANPVLAWGGHISTRLDWGAANSAVSISGSPYHTRLVDIDGGGGNQDRSLSGDAVTFPSSLTIIKDAQPNSTQDFSFSVTGGLTPTTFTLDDDSDPALSNTQVFSKILVTTTSGITIDATETPASGWSLQSSISCSVTSPNGGTQTAITNGVRVVIKEGENVSCTFVNTRDTGKLEVKKLISSNPSSGKFNLQIDGTTEKADAVNNDSTGEKLVTTGTHTVGETAGTGTSLTDYTASIECRGSNGTGAVIASSSDSGPLNVNVSLNADIVCTITNVRNTGKLEVRKSIASNPSGGKFNLQIDGNTEKADAVNNDTTGEKTVITGSHTVGETAGAGTTLSDYAASIECRGSNGTGAVVASGSDSGPLNVSVTKDADIVCTITNSRNTGKLEVRKTITANPTSGKFNLQIDGNTEKADAVNGDTTGEKTLISGTHTVGETAGTGTTLADYTASIECRGSDGAGAVVASSTNSGPLNVSVTQGSDIVCTITNTRNTGKLEVNKVIASNPSGGKFNLQIDSTTEKADAVNGDTTGEKTLPTGTHSVGETAGTGTTLSDYAASIECRGGDGAGSVVASSSTSGPLNVSVTQGSDIVCTITNTRNTGKLEVKKAIASNPTSGKFNLQIDGNTEKADAVNGDTTGEKTLITGTHTVGETAGTSTTLTDYTASIECKDGNGAGAVVASSATSGPLNVSVTKDADIVCTVTNTRNTGKLEVRKVIASNPSGGKFNLQIDSTTEKADAVNGDTTGEKTLPTGNHSVGETAGTGTTLSDYTASIECRGGDGAGAVVASGSNSGPLTVSVTKDADIVCTITNVRNSGTIEVIKKIDQNPAGGQFNLRIDGVQQAANVGNNGTTGAIAVSTGTHSASETAGGNNTNLADYTTSIACKLGSTTVASGSTASLSGIPVNSGDAVVCTITNTYIKATVGNSTTQTWTINDIATLTGVRAGATSTITFKLFGPGNPTCADTGSVNAATSYIYSFQASLTAAQSGTVIVNTTGTGTTQGSNVVSQVGTYKWRVAFSGNDFNNSFAGTCGEETTTIASSPNQP